MPFDMDRISNQRTGDSSPNLTAELQVDAVEEKKEPLGFRNRPEIRRTGHESSQTGLIDREAREENAPAYLEHGRHVEQLQPHQELSGNLEKKTERRMSERPKVKKVYRSSDDRVPVNIPWRIIIPLVLIICAVLMVYFYRDAIFAFTTNLLTEILSAIFPLLVIVAIVRSFFGKRK